MKELSLYSLFCDDTELWRGGSRESRCMHLQRQINWYTNTGKVKVKVNMSLCFKWAPRRESILGEWRYSSSHFLTSALDRGEWSASRSGRFAPRERAPGTHWIGGWVGPRAVLDAVVKRKIPSPRQESNPRVLIAHPVAQRYTDLVGPQ
jgi:hypothetical protein